MNDEEIFPSSKFTKGNLDGKYKHSWVEGSFNFEENEAGQPACRSTRDYLGKSISQKSISLLFALVLVGLGVIFVKVFILQIVQGNYYRSLAEGNRVRMRPIPAERGVVFDRNNRELVQNVPSFLLSIVPQDLPREVEPRRLVIQQIAALSGVPEEYIQELLKKYKNYSYESLVIKENLDYETALKLYIQNSELPGVLIEKGIKRSYLNTDKKSGSEIVSMSHIMGYLGKISDEELTELKDENYLPSDYVGKVGVEKSYENDLRGEYGRKKIEVNAAGRELKVLAEEPPIPGKNLTLTIDFEAQQQLEEMVRKQLVLSKKTRAAAIAIDPNDGSIIALVSWPAFDNNDFSGGIDIATYEKYLKDDDRPLFNRAIAGSYPSGSTIKPVMAAAALEEKIITQFTGFLSTGGLNVGGHLFKDWKAGGHGFTDVSKALAWSVNTFFYYIGGGYKEFVGLGVDKISMYLKKFNLGKETGIDLPGENSGFVPDREWKEKVKGERWYVGDTYNLSIGQGNLLVTPLQVAVWTAAVANGGEVIKPHIGLKLVEPLSKKTELIQKQVIADNIISAENITIVRQGMRQCVVSGSCKILDSLPFKTAAKTGTAQWSATKPEHAWFTAFAPYNKPKIVIAVLVEEGGEGSVVAAPIAKEFLLWWSKKYL